MSKPEEAADTADTCENSVSFVICIAFSVMCIQRSVGAHYQ